MPTLEGNEALMRRWFEEVWNQGRAEAIDEMCAPDVIARGMGPNGTDLTGVDAFKAAHQLFRGAFPDLKLTLGPVVVGGDMTAVQYTCEATHRGDHLGVPATQRPVRFTGMAIARYRDGRIIEGWNCIDLLAVLQQTGSLQPLSALP